MNGLINLLTKKQSRGVAIIIGQKGGGEVIAQTKGGAKIFLEGEMANGKKCYYDRVSNKILSEAPDLPATEYWV